MAVIAKIDQQEKQNDQNARIKWRFIAGPNGSGRADIKTTAAISNDKVYFISGSSCDENQSNQFPELCLYAVDIQTGQERWKVEKQAFHETDIVIADGVLYFGLTIAGPGTGYLYAMDAKTRQVRWTVDFADAALSTPTVAGGVVYFGTQSIFDDKVGHIYAVDAKTGSGLWDFEASWNMVTYVEATKMLYYSTTNKEGDYVYNDYLHAVNASTGLQEWTVRLPVRISDNAAFHDGLLYSPGWGGLYAIDSRTGQVRGSYETDHVSAEFSMVVGSVALAGDSIYLELCKPGGPEATGPCYLSAIDRQTKQEKWRFDVPSSLPSPPIVEKDTVYFASSSGTVFSLDAVTGTEKWKVDTGDTIDTAPVLADGIIYVGNWWAGTMYAIYANPLAPHASSTPLSISPTVRN
jgi:outer membrane protein assembly factor BamB